MVRLFNLSKNIVMDIIGYSIGGFGIIVSIVLGIYQKEIRQFWDSIISKSDPVEELNYSVNLIGRKKSLDRIYEYFKDGRRLVTIHGFGGIGKTALAKAFQLKFGNSISSKSYFVELETHTTIIGLCQGIHETIKGKGKGISDAEQNPVDVIEKLLRREKNILLILDNFEQLIDVKHNSIEHWIRNTQVKILVTSIFPLELGAIETKIGLKPLSTPNSKSSISVKNSESYQLFTQILEEEGISYAFKKNNFYDLYKIFKGLGGFPFAIEIYAPLMHSMSLKEVLSVVENYTEIKLEREDKKHRFRSFNNLILSLFERTLTDDQKSILVQCSIFSIPFTLEAAEHIIVNESNIPVAMTLHDLQKKNLLEVTNDDEKRYFLLPILKRYLRDNSSLILSEKEENDLIERWGLYFVNLGERLNKKIHSIDGNSAIDQIAVERENFFDIQSALLSKNPELAARSILSFSETMEVRGPFGLREEKIAASFHSLSNSSSHLKHKLLLELSKVYWAQGRWFDAYDLAEKAVNSENERNPNFFTALNHLGKVKSDLGFYKAALKDFNRVVDNIEHNPQKAFASKEIGHCFDKLGDIETANQYFQTAKRLSSNDHFFLAQIYNTQSLANWHHGFLESALEFIEKAFKISNEVKIKNLIPAHTTNKGLILTDLGRFEEAIESFKKAEEIHEREQWHAVNYGGWGRALLRQGKESNFSLAQDYLQNGLNKAIGVNYPETIAFYHGELALLASRKDHKLRAYELIRKAIYLENWMGAVKDCRYFNHMVLCSKVALELGINSVARESFNKSKKLQKIKNYTSNHESFQIREDCLTLNDLQKKTKT